MAPKITAEATLEAMLSIPNAYKHKLHTYYLQHGSCHTIFLNLSRNIKPQKTSQLSGNTQTPPLSSGFMNFRGSWSFDSPEAWIHQSKSKLCSQHLARSAAATRAWSIGALGDSGDVTVGCGIPWSWKRGPFRWTRPFLEVDVPSH